jgi:hypothetical protein
MTHSVCCCSIGGAWGNSDGKTCTPCPAKGTALYEKLCSSPGGGDIDECVLFPGICENGM